MFPKAHFILLLIVFGIGFAAGLYVNLLLPAKSGVVDISSIILAIFGGIGLVVTLTRWVIDWYNQPTLEIVGIIEASMIIPAGETFLDHYLLSWYFLRIRNIRKRGAAESCKANLAISDTSLGNIPTHWRRTNQSTTVDISTVEEISLFATVRKYNQIFFPTVIVSKGNLEGGIEKPYEEFIHKELEIQFGSKTGRFLQNPYRKKIEDMMKEAKKE